MKNVSILGSTGSIGTQTLDIIRENREEYQVVVLSCGKNRELLKEQIDEFEPQIIVVEAEEAGREFAKLYPHIDVYWGERGLAAAAEADCDILVNALMGMRGLVPTYNALCKGRNIAFANKETLVAGGELIMAASGRYGGKLIPVDSEHSAIFQCLCGAGEKSIKKILLTASGGPFRGYTKEQLESATLEQALAHPNWTMGAKITIDSATMMNKGLEVIEARWLFDVPASKIQIVVHPQSIIHSMVEYEDTSVLAQMGLPDMRVPIAYALSYPNRKPNNFKSLDLFEIGKLTFETADPNTFKCIRLAYEAIEAGGSHPVVLNGANEELVAAFLKRQIKFTDIQNNIERVLEKYPHTDVMSLDDILEIDKESRRLAKELILKG